MKDRHVVEALGRTKVVIEDGKVTFVGKPEVTYCPLFAKHRGIKVITSEVVKENMEFRIRDFGFCAPTRKLRMRDFLSFGVSELLGMCVSKGLLDAAVIAGDGVGTVVVSDPEIIQGIGGRMSGQIETTPHIEVIEAVGRKNVLDPETAKIDMFAGTQKAFKMGYRKVGVTVARADDARAIRDGFGDNVALFAVHTTGVDQKDARTLFETCDVISGCASRWLREEAKTKALLQAGTKVPVYAATPFGKKILEQRLKQIGMEPASGKDDDAPSPLI
ncbi:MAG TPA: methanogenesis marker 8 protein [Methanomassiliicoccales archaeon]|nr:methanogenesis marker 8 protein [Methanomassiliicoccales archaeon]